MKRFFISVITKFLILSIFIKIIFNISNSSEYLVFDFTNLHRIFLVAFTILVSIKYDFLRLILEKENNKKSRFLYSILIILIFLFGINLVYYVIPKYYHSKNWYYTNYNDDNWKLELADFWLLPVQKYVPSFNIRKMIFWETILSFIFLAFVYINSKFKKGELAYISERIFKIIYRYNIILDFIIYYFTIPNKYIIIKSNKKFITGVLFIIVVTLIIKYYLSIKSCKNKRISKYGNVILVVTPNNYKFTFSDNILNPLRVFRKYDNKKIGKALIVDGKQYTFASYDAIRFNLLDINKFTNVGYLILIDGKISELVNSEKSNECFKEKITNISKETSKFIICNNFMINKKYKTNLSKYIRKSFGYRYIKNLDVKTILNVVDITPKADKLKSDCEKLLEYVKKKELKNYYNRLIEEDSDKFLDTDPYISNLAEKSVQQRNDYIKYGLGHIISSFSYVEYFYTLLKMSEYTIHYLALKNIIDNPEIAKCKNIRGGYLSMWKDCLGINDILDPKKPNNISGTTNIQIDETQIINSVDFINLIFNSNYKKKSKYELKNDIGSCIVNIRNKMLAHGVITQKDAEKIIDHLFNLTFVLVKKFVDTDVTIQEDEKIKYIFEKDIFAIYKNNNKLFLYSYTATEPKEDDTKIDLYKECLNYETGNRKVIDKKVKLYKNYIYSDEEIIRELGKWEIK